MNSDLQGSRDQNLDLVDWSKELWFALMFLCIGFTVWPLMVYFLGRAIGVEYFLTMPLRVWAEQKVYGPLAEGGFRFVTRFLFLCFPYFLSLFIRFTLHKVRDSK